MKKVAVSGYFDPIHEGHLEMIEKAAEYGDVTVILNTTEQCIAKKGYEAIPLKTKFAVLKALKGVSDVMLSIDKDQTVCKSLEFLQPDYFVNGGDRKDHTPESTTCKANHIKAIFGAGEKIQSSSKINNRAVQERPWGRWRVLYRGDGYKIKILEVEPGKSLSMQRHRDRDEDWILLNPGVWASNDGYDFTELFIPRGEWHRLHNKNKKMIEVLEVSYGDYIEENDIERLDG